MSGRYPEVLEHLFRRPEHLFTAGDGSFCVAVGQEAVVLAAMQHGMHQLDCALSVEHVYGHEMVAVPASGIRRFLMQSPYHVLSRHCLAHMLGQMCGILVHVTYEDASLPVVFDFRPSRPTDAPDLVFSIERPANDPHKRPLYHLGPPAPAPIHAPADHDGEGAEVPDGGGGGDQPPSHSGHDALADGGGVRAAAAAGIAAEENPAPPGTLAPTRIKAPDRYWLDNRLTVGPAPHICWNATFRVFGLSGVLDATGVPEFGDRTRWAGRPGCPPRPAAILGAA